MNEGDINCSDIDRPLRISLGNLRKAEPRKVLDGMKGYAAFPPDYSQKLFRRIERDNLKRFDNLTICKTREETSGVDGGKD